MRSSSSFSVVSLALAWQWRGVSLTFVRVLYWYALASWQLSYALLFSPGFMLLYQACCRIISSAPCVSGFHCDLCICVCNDVLVVLKCMVFRAFCSVLLSFSVFSPSSLTLIIIYQYYCGPYFSTELSVQCDGCLGWGSLWLTGLVAGLQVRQAFRVFLLQALIYP